MDESNQSTILKRATDCVPVRLIDTIPPFFCFTGVFCCCCCYFLPLYVAILKLIKLPVLLFLTETEMLSMDVRGVLVVD